MPLYEYQCEACDNRFERIQRFSDPPAETCPACGKGPVRKLISSPAIQFKGSGWYITDYAKKSATDGGSAETGSSSDKKGDTSNKGDSAAKTDTSTSSTNTTKGDS